MDTLRSLPQILTGLLKAVCFSVMPIASQQFVNLTLYNLKTEF
jgi:hypothetical protein